MVFRREKVDESTDRTLVMGIAETERCDNSVTTSKYNIATFLPVAILEQFRRVANLYFLIIGGIMAVGFYTTAFESAISPWTTLGPLAFVIGISLIQEGSADYNRHRSDSQTNNFPCVVLRRADELEEEGGHREMSVLDGNDVKVNLTKSYYMGGLATPRPTADSPGSSCLVAFQRVKRMDMRQGQIALIRNRDMIPADMIMLASSSDGGNAYIETSSIDGETNLKLRTSPHLPKSVMRQIREDIPGTDDDFSMETLEQATKRLARMSALAFPAGISALENPGNSGLSQPPEESAQPNSGLRLVERGISVRRAVGSMTNIRASSLTQNTGGDSQQKYVTALKSEPPNASVNTFTGVMVMPPVQANGPSIEVPLNADNILLRGAMLRNTEWAIGLVVFTGEDTKLVRNSVKTPSKFSQLDQLMNRTVLCIVLVMILCIAYLATFAVFTNDEKFDQLWYISYNKDTAAKWPYLQDLDPPEWTTTPSNWIQIFFLFVTLLNNFVPLSLYVTVEVVTVALRIFINLDIDMYHPATDTRAVARSTTVTDLGQVEYVFSDKTGTLTQNVMRFKRCSVDGLAFGAPVEKATPGAAVQDELNEMTSFHPLRALLIGQVSVSPGGAGELGVPPVPARKTGGPRQQSFGLESLGHEGHLDHGESRDSVEVSQKLTFNAEMFLRVMSLCHTVVVEKDYDANPGFAPEDSGIESAPSGGFFSNLFGGKPPPPKPEPKIGDVEANNGTATKKVDVGASGKGKDGAPSGFAYQAESPDEGALVEAASQRFDFQVVGRDSSGIKLSCASPSLLADGAIVEGIKAGELTAKSLAAETASPLGGGSRPDSDVPTPSSADYRIETWSVLAINKFDSTRKRMSILVRSPPELGSITMLLCKGADSAMLDPGVLETSTFLMSGDEGPDEIRRKSSLSPGGGSEDEGDWERETLLSLQSHLGEFAREGLRTLVLGMRFLSEDDTASWLKEFTAASTAIKGRDEKLTAAALSIEKGLHVVGATAIEDKLQDGVPETIAMLGAAGIKLWVLTGDKRETAKEIGYATKVLTEKMRPGLVEVAKGPENHVRTKMAMQFMKLVKYAKLPEYQKVAVGEENGGKFWETFFFRFGKFRRRMSRGFRRLVHNMFLYCCYTVGEEDVVLKKLNEEEKAEEGILQVTERRRGVRERAEKIVRDYLDSPEGRQQRAARGAAVGAKGEFSADELNLTSSDDPDVFSRAQSARKVMDERRSQGQVPSTELRGLTIANVTAHTASADDAPFIDEEVLSMRSHLPAEGEEKKDFDRMKRTLLERLFAVDRAVRHGRLVKHLNRDKLQVIEEGFRPSASQPPESAPDPTGLDGPKGLVIEGAALDKLLGDPQLEELLFAVANTCDSVIACRVSPAQKAQLVQLVRRYVVPEPVTLAIGDGANDVGMIQEAHVGVGISGKEGQQAVNASDFAIAQFRYLQELVLIHGRWSFFRQSIVVLFSFYKNAILAGCLIVFTSENLYSGTPLFDEWIIAMLNFVAAVPIGALGLFDRCLDKEYIRAHPEVYGPTRRNELMTKRVLLRWVLLTFVHTFTIYYLTVPALTDRGGGGTSAFRGLMFNDPDAPGDGEGGDLKSVGLVTFSCLIILLSFKVVLESRSIIHGQWPACTCRSNAGEGWINRLAYTWISNAYLSIGFYLFAIYVYMLIGRSGPSSFSPFVDTTYHVLHTRSLSWMIILLVPLGGMAFDVAGKVFSNLFYPTQTQIHVEIFARELGKPVAEPSGSSASFRAQTA